MKLCLLWFIAILIGATTLATSDAVHANGDQIVVVSQSAVSDFPNGVKFFIEATSPDEIDDIRVTFKKLGQSNRSGYRVVDFEPGTEITGESLIPSGSGGEFIPPGTRIEYSFEIRDKTGRTLRTEDQVFVYLDHRLEWQTLSDGLITLYYNDTVIDGRAQAILEAAQETLQRMGPILGIDPKDPLHIVTYGDYGSMVEALPFRAQAVRDNLITQGTAFSEERVLLVLGAGSDYLGTTSHEFTHLLVADAAGRATAKFPSWLNEGLAEYGNIEPGEEYDRALSRAIENGRLRPLWFQATFSGTPDDIIIAYGQGKSVVEFMLSNYDEQKMADLVVALKRTFDIDTALQETYGFDQYGLDTEWRKSLGLEPLPEPEDRVAQQQATPTPPPTSILAATAAPTISAQETAVPVPANTPEPVEQDTNQASPGCSAPSHSGNSVTDLAMLALLGGPLAMLTARGIRRRR
ncbi:MAG: peptidase MA family metallohydrolase [Chloroflexi bacterium]|nr:peptidase MA family metallohydrolase [Chloroflexota bacterium]MDA1218144.1 peptidase MA family metallohydrolase [Chloroflexota bacterium]PKB57382.1 MAG: hypothetical protein BZY73_03565 [SAR202 cluster bacterium Casp-Chloro-G3]